MLRFKSVLTSNFLVKTMSSFTQVFNPMSGKTEWEIRCPDYDYYQEVARSAFADMLHDVERNKKYYAALKIAIDRTHQKGLKANVLDIGTGTGLLSMMAVQCGADSVVACEAFRPMADCAEKIIAKNNMSQQIQLIKLRSTDIVIGKDIKSKANILVTEVFDTELIGEGAIDIFKHAHKHLLEPDCIVVPDSGIIYAQVVESPLVHAFNKPKNIANLDGEILLTTPTDIKNCPGSTSLHDIQLSQLPKESFKTIIEPVPIFEFDWSGRTELRRQRRTITETRAKNSGMIQAVFMWWDLKMDTDGDIVLSCAPYWAHPDYEQLSKNNSADIPPQNVIPWRDHWMQAVYYLPKEVKVDADKKLSLISYHDEFSLWFDVKTEMEDASEVIEAPLCNCGFHIAYSRTRIGQMNDNLRNKRYLRVLEEIINPKSTVLVINDGSLLGLATATMGAKHVYFLDKNHFSRKVMHLYVNRNQLKNVTIIESINEIKNFKEITEIVSEPHFNTSIVPWDNLYFYNLIRPLLKDFREDVKILPLGVIIQAVPVEFLDLQKIRSPLGVVEDFDLSEFDALVYKASNLADAKIEAQPLWEYPCKALSEAITLCSMDAKDNASNSSETVTFSKEDLFKCSGECNGVAFWTVWHLDGSDHPKSMVTTGPKLPIEPGKFLDWDMHTRQGVHFVRLAKRVTDGDKFSLKINFIPQTGIVDCLFEL